MVRTGPWDSWDPALPQVGKATALAIYGCGHSEYPLFQDTSKWPTWEIPPKNGGLDGKIIYKHVPAMVDFREAIVKSHRNTSQSKVIHPLGIVKTRAPFFWCGARHFGRNPCGWPARIGTSWPTIPEPCLKSFIFLPDRNVDLTSRPSGNLTELLQMTIYRYL